MGEFYPGAIFQGSLRTADRCAELSGDIRVLYRISCDDYPGFFPAYKGGIQERRRDRLVDLGCRSIVLLAGCDDTFLRNVPCGSLYHGNCACNPADSRQPVRHHHRPSRECGAPYKHNGYLQQVCRCCESVDFCGSCDPPSGQENWSELRKSRRSMP